MDTRYAFCNYIKEVLKNDLIAIISVGTYSIGNHIKHWSDIDLLIAVKTLNLHRKLQIAAMKYELEKRQGISFGINVITRQELTRPILPTTTLDAKTLQAMYELHHFPERLLYSYRLSYKDIFCPNRSQVRAFSLRTVMFFVLRNRKAVTSLNLRKLPQYKEQLLKEIRACFIITKAAIQYFIPLEQFDSSSILTNAMLVFPRFDFSSLKILYNLKYHWKETKEHSELTSFFQLADDFIEHFSRHFITYLRKSKRDTGSNGSNLAKRIVNSKNKSPTSLL